MNDRRNLIETTAWIISEAQLIFAESCVDTLEECKRLLIIVDSLTPQDPALTLPLTLR
jgi:hypothetical protein